jgi:alpha-tubulin suppressor-like RCC1 family protein
VTAALGCGSDTSAPPQQLRLSRIIIDTGPRLIALDTTVTLTAKAYDTAGKVVSVPLVWTSSSDSIATFALGGKLVAKDTGIIFVTASSLGVTSAPVGFRVALTGPESIAVFQFNPPMAISPGAEPVDSLRVLVLNIFKGPAPGAKVVFAVTAGGGSVSPDTVTVGNNALASTKWRLGPAVGKNTVTATVIRSDGTVNKRVANNPVTFTVKAYDALKIVQGDAQSGTVLSPLTTAPSVKLVDSLGNPRAGIPITFSPTGNGRVANTVVSTNVEGIASPGVWTLGDAQGKEQLIVTVEGARVALSATASGTTVRFTASQVVTAQASTCAMTSDQLVSCLGQAPQNGTGDTASVSKPTLTRGSIHFTSFAGGGAHFCGTSTDLSIYCWGISALVDTSGASTSTATPTRLPSNIAWLQVSPGAQHTCALANDRTAYCWGSDASGQLGDNDTTTRFVPKPVVGGFRFTTVSSGASHACGITTDAVGFCWGLNSTAQLGDSTSANRRTPTAVAGGLKWKTIGAGGNWSCGLIQSGTAYCWGGGTQHVVPTSYPTAPVFTSLAVGAAHACALAGDGRAYCWGANNAGQLGDSTTVSHLDPAPVVSPFRFTSISAGFEHTCGMTTDGFVACWGRNLVGELGFSTPSLQLTPRYIVIGVTPP